MRTNFCGQEMFPQGGSNWSGACHSLGYQMHIESTIELYYNQQHEFVRAALNARRSSQEKAVCLSVCLANACIVTKRKKDLSRFLYHTEDHLA